MNIKWTARTVQYLSLCFFIIEKFIMSPLQNTRLRNTALIWSMRLVFAWHQTEAPALVIFETRMDSSRMCTARHSNHPGGAWSQGGLHQAYPPGADTPLGPEPNPPRGDPPEQTPPPHAYQTPLPFINWKTCFLVGLKVVKIAQFHIPYSGILVNLSTYPVNVWTLSVSCMKLKEFWPPGGAHPSGPLQIRHWLKINTQPIDWEWFGPLGESP